MDQRCPGTLQIWAEPFTELRVPKLFNLRLDPYERADITSNTYYDPRHGVILGIRDGLRFSREGRSFLLWGGPEDPLERRAQALATVRSIGKVFVLAIILDIVCRLIAVHWIFPLETLGVAIVVAVIPYLVVRRLMSWLAKPGQGQRPPE